MLYTVIDFDNVSFVECKALVGRIELRFRVRPRVAIGWDHIAAMQVLSVEKFKACLNNYIFEANSNTHPTLQLINLKLDLYVSDVAVSLLR